MLSNYDPGLVVLTLGSLIISGYSDGTMIDCQRDEDAFSKKTGAQGDTVRVRNRNRNGYVTFNLQQNSPLNDALSALVIEDETLGTGFRPLQIKDLNSRTLVSAPTAWIRKVANVVLGQDAENREWMVDCHNLTVFVGGGLVIA